VPVDVRHHVVAVGEQTFLYHDLDLRRVEVLQEGLQPLEVPAAGDVLAVGVEHRFFEWACFGAVTQVVPVLRERPLDGIPHQIQEADVGGRGRHPGGRVREAGRGVPR